MKKILLSLMLGLFLISFICAESQSSLGSSFKQGQQVTITQGCTNSTYANLTKIYVDGTQNTFINSEKAMIQTSNDNYDYNFSNVQTIGTYVAIGHCDLDGIDTQWALTFEVTPSGFIGTLGFYILILVLSLAFIILGYSVQDVWIIILGSFGLLLAGLFILLYGIDGMKDTAYTYGFGIITIMLGGYLMVRCGLEQIQD